MSQFTPQPNQKGDAEYAIRKRFEREWKSLSPTDRVPFVQRAMRECGKDATVKHGEYVNGLLETYAWTLFAETCDPDEAKAIQNAGWSTMATIEAGAAPAGGW